jgi:ribosome maturation factor RimP
MPIFSQISPMHATSRDLPLQATPPRVDADAVRAVILPVVDAHGLELCDLEWTGGVLCVFVEHPSRADQPLGGVTLDECVAVSRDLSTALDVADLIPHAYNLEVSSPGLNRPLKRAVDFQRSVGKLAKCKLVRPASDGQMALRGTIVSSSDQGIKMEVDGKSFDVALANIREARLVFEVGPRVPRGVAGPKSNKPGNKRQKKTKKARKRK